MIRKLSIKSGGALLGRAFQGHAAVRKLTLTDHQLITAYAKELAVEPRARLLPEERLEALLISGNESAVDRLLREEPSGLAEQRKRYLTSQAVKRDPMLVAELRNRYEGICQICEWSPRASYGPDICETHHVRWLSRGGEDDLSNMVLLCPNHHRAIHRCDAQFDWEAFAFVFSTRVEQLSVRRHLIAA